MQNLLFQHCVIKVCTYSSAVHAVYFSKEQSFRGSAISIFEPPKGTESGWNKISPNFFSKGTKIVLHQPEARKIRVLFYTLL